MSNEPLIISPPRSEIAALLKQGDAPANLKTLFSTTSPRNNKLDDVFAKVCAVNDFYGTNIFSPPTVAKHIVALDVDALLAAGDAGIVNAIAHVRIGNGESRDFYSFATKYCNHHNPTAYPIYDSFIEKMLVYFRNKDKFCEFSRKNLKEYSLYKNILMDFRKHYDLEAFDLNQVGQYLWQAGKKYFPKESPIKS